MSLGGWRRLILVLAVVVAAASPAVSRSVPTKLEVPDGFSGVVLVARGSRVLLWEAHGTAGGAPIRRDSRFWIASAGKQFVAAAIMKLVEAGRVRLDDPLRRYLPAVPRDKADITVRQLLSHTSGLAQSYVSEEQTARPEAVRRMLAEPLAGPRGDRFRYSNSNLQLAAAIVETASGQPYGAFVERELWGAAGLRGTGQAGDAGSRSVTPTLDALPPRLQRPYWGEQGVYSTAGDLLRWRRALTGGRLLRSASVAEMWKPVVKISEGYAALGWFGGTTARGNAFIFARGNEDFGANALIYLYPESDVVIIVLTHAGDVPGEETSWSRRVQQALERQLGL